jgi:hypothetical protein
VREVPPRPRRTRPPTTAPVPVPYGVGGERGCRRRLGQRLQQQYPERNCRRRHHRLGAAQQTTKDRRHRRPLRLVRIAGRFLSPSLRKKSKFFEVYENFSQYEWSQGILQKLGGDRKKSPDNFFRLVKSSLTACQTLFRRKDREIGKLNDKIQSLEAKYTFSHVFSGVFLTYFFAGSRNRILPWMRRRKRPARNAPAKSPL